MFTNEVSSTDCSTYRVISHDGLSVEEINYLTSLTVEACYSSTNTITMAKETNELASAVYSCDSCVAVSVDLTGAAYAAQLYDAWYLVVETGDYRVLMFVAFNCRSAVAKWNNFAFDNYNLRNDGDDTADNDNDNDIQFSSSSSSSLNNINRHHKNEDNDNENEEKKEGEEEEAIVCLCSSFTWYSTSGINAYQKAEIEELASDACQYYTLTTNYVDALSSYFGYYYVFANVIATNSDTEGSFSMNYEWYGAFRVGCFYTLIFQNPPTCSGYQPPKTLPTPTSILGASVSLSSSPSPSYSPSYSPSLSRGVSASISSSHSPSASPVIGCGNPACSGRGVCRNNVCNCEAFYYGPQCEYQYCPGNCTNSNQGTCDPSSGECQCIYPYYGCDCSSVLYNCSCEHGTCNELTGECTCDLGWTGTNCNISAACEDNCNNHGRCTSDQTCDCFPGWTGQYCNITDTNCTHGCQNGGVCNNGRCECVYPYFGPECRWLQCGTGGSSQICSGHGKCNHQTGSCYCDAGFSGCYCSNYTGSGTPPSPTSKPTIPNFTSSSSPSMVPSRTPSPSVVYGCGNPACNNHGVCQNGVCHCSSFYYGPQCQNEYCPGNCTFNGYCNPQNGECQCYYPYYGCDCSSVLYNCSCEHGTCNQLTGECACDPGWTGTSCNVSVACQNNCNNRGRCNINETCDCFPGWTGEFCNITDRNCSHGCQNGGYCNPDTGTCSCPEPYFGPQCLWLHCGNGGTNLTCSGHGKCNYQTGSCYCDAGFSGCYCTNWSGSGTPPPAASPPSLPPKLECPNLNGVCSGNGQCNESNGSCYCDDGWYGCYCNQYHD